MNFREILEHHILDHPLASFFSIGGIQFSFTKHLLMIWITSLILISLSLLLKVSSGSFSKKVKTILEIVILYIRDKVVLPTLGDQGGRYLHYFLTLFFFILVCNLLGLVPGASTATGNIAITLTLSLCTFVLIHLAGIRKLGVIHYIKSIVPSGLPVWLVPLMFPIELIGFLTKTFALSIRLFMNMIAGHIVVLAFLGLIFIFASLNPWVGLATAPFSVLMSLFIYFLELLIVIPLQAFIFTFLTALFVGAAMHPEH